MKYEIQHIVMALIVGACFGFMGGLYTPEEAGRELDAHPDMIMRVANKAEVAVVCRIAQRWMDAKAIMSRRRKDGSWIVRATWADPNSAKKMVESDMEKMAAQYRDGGDDK